MRRQVIQFIHLDLALMLTHPMPLELPRCALWVHL
ncbi:hypothetical protein RDI58_022361 [Solanum bulbocastanum]|uniref:Uncharacterized protein n=1 Tax=Solanum bulbocastanum TaxID=147425 RepID=A0AAN8Y5P9_SOLBU